MTNHQPLTNPDTDGFPELVYALHDALADLCGDVDLDYPALAVELADTAWKQLRPAVLLASVWDQGYAKAVRDAVPTEPSRRPGNPYRDGAA